MSELTDLLLRGSPNPFQAPMGGSTAAGLGGASSQPSPDPTSADLLAQLQQQREQALAQSNEEIEPEKLGFGRRLALALANAGSAYAAGINPNVRQQNFIEPLLALSERRARRETAQQQARARTQLTDLTRQEMVLRRGIERGEDRDAAEAAQDKRIQADADRDAARFQAQDERDQTRIEADERAQAERFQAQKDRDKASLEAQMEENRRRRQHEIADLDKRLDARLGEIEARSGVEGRIKAEEKFDKEDRNLSSMRNQFLLGDIESGIPPYVDTLIKHITEKGDLAPAEARERIMRIAREMAEVFGGRPATVERIMDRIEGVLLEKLPDTPAGADDGGSLFDSDSILGKTFGSLGGIFGGND